MWDFSAIGMFCEDIREEANGVNTLVGILPDNMVIGELPGLLPKLCAYVRVHLNVESDIREFRVALCAPDGTELSARDFERHLIEESLASAANTKAPFVGLITKMLLVPFRIPSHGRLTLQILAKEKRTVCGVLNLLREG